MFDEFSKRNLKFEKKLEFLEAVGIVSARSLARLNSIRNKMEHKYEIPKIGEIEVYYDLALAFVAVLQRVLMSSLNSEVELIVKDVQGKDIGVLQMKYDFDFDTPSIAASWDIDGMKPDTLMSDMSEPNEFAFFMKVLFLLYQKESFASNQYVAAQLGG